MQSVNQLIRAKAMELPGIPYWVVEKDYALSYLLAGIARTAPLSQVMSLKGGTALSKLYFEHYRFSEDLDFTLHAGAPDLDMGTAIQNALRVAEVLLQERGPFAVSGDRLVLRERHPGGQEAFVARIRFPGQREALCRLKVEITVDETVLRPPQRRPLWHRFPETLDATLLCYSLDEIVAEKLRALLQSSARLRQRGWGASRVCRDYYDLWRIAGAGGLNLATLPDLVTEKCAHRDVSFVSALDFVAPALVATAKAEWQSQLVPFVPNCPTADHVLREVSQWLARVWPNA